ncbi:MAG: ABC transporter ATP-binding protein [Acidobacteriota bacterium]
MLEVRGLSKQYQSASGPIQVMSDVNLTLTDGDAVSIVGPSGSGKSTLLYAIGGIEPPSSGTVTLDGTNPFLLDDTGLAAFRNRQVGFVFQDHHLMPQCTVLENVLLPTLLTPDSEGAALGRATDLIDRVGLGPRRQHRPHQLSGGEKQRVAVARSLMRRPRLILCDEPTGNLDGDSAEAVVALLLELHREQANMLVVVTHNLELAQRFGRRFRLSGANLQPLP